MNLLTLGILCSGGKFVYDMVQSDKLNCEAERKTFRALERVSQAQIRNNEIKNKLEESLTRMMNRKRAILSTTMGKFLEIYKKIIKIDFHEPEFEQSLKQLDGEMTSKLQAQITIAQTDVAMPILTTNVAIGLLTGGFLGMISSSIVDDSKRSLEFARLESKKANIVVAQFDTEGLAYKGIIEYITRITNVLTKLNQIFNKALLYSEDLIRENGLDKTKYKEEERASLAACINIAVLIKDILDAPIIDENGTFKKETFVMIEKGEQYTNVIDKKEEVYE